MKKVAKAYNTGFNLEQGKQGFEVYLLTTSKSGENKLTDLSLWRTKSVDNCILISGDLKLYS
jgi:hypothetical protein